MSMQIGVHIKMPNFPFGSVCLLHYTRLRTRILHKGAITELLKFNLDRWPLALDLRKNSARRSPPANSPAPQSFSKYFLEGSSLRMAKMKAQPGTSHVRLIFQCQRYKKYPCIITDRLHPTLR